MSNHYSDMRDILICFAYAAEENDGESNVEMFSAKVQTLMGMSVSRKIRALCYLFDVMLKNQSAAVEALMNHLDPDNTDGFNQEQAFTALQMAITAAAANYQNGNNQ